MYSINMETIYKKLEGKETQFASCVAEALTMGNIVEELSYINGMDRWSTISKDESLEYLKQVTNVTGEIYRVLHAWDKSKSCYKVHESWRQESIDIYAKLCKYNVISDEYKLL